MAEYTQQSAPTPSTGHMYKAAQIAHTTPFKQQPQTTRTVHTGEPKHSPQTAQTLPKEHARGHGGLFGGHRRRTVTTRKQTRDQPSLEGTEHAHGADGACDSSQTHLQGVGASVLSYPQSALNGNVGRRKRGAKVDADVAKHLFEDKYSNHQGSRIRLGTTAREMYSAVQQGSAVDFSALEYKIHASRIGN
ncbi:hypothetical protein SARC_01550 [Sphaeroforma arctica JP610]|uniref:Uncharacterized protein n=1 Tax=Sphaeroforma arctica JP610 TaxID=667725 RepID=A0A0L0GDG1_9EUKA|nr:hypothetical protein SARC_01550 [Sphaeroforma arctica JP610]KNC86288.1 hypothetical protein SARC_01550 [Sphaeroforma arctica JP610]|eukprot:XP_014160190.1 hypothetical protein SARC_01550 [Sphaeroforma arctica JP610]